MAVGIVAFSRNKLEQEIDASIFSVQREEILEDGGWQDTNFKINFSPQTSYSFQEEQFITGMQYHAPVLDYVKLWYGENKEKRVEYTSSTEAVAEAWFEGESEILTVREATDTFMDLQYQAIQGNVYQVNVEERRRFALWINFNPALFKLLESTQGLTRDVNYAVN